MAQHHNDPVLHHLMGIGLTVGGGKSMTSLRTGATEATTPLAAAKAAIKETSGLLIIMVEAIWRLWQS